MNTGNYFEYTPMTYSGPRSGPPGSLVPLKGCPCCSNCANGLPCASLNGIEIAGIPLVPIIAAIGLAAILFPKARKKALGF